MIDVSELVGVTPEVIELVSVSAPASIWASRPSSADASWSS